MGALSCAAVQGGEGVIVLVAARCEDAAVATIPKHHRQRQYGYPCCPTKALQSSSSLLRGARGNHKELPQSAYGLQATTLGRPASLRICLCAETIPVGPERGQQRSLAGGFRRFRSRRRRERARLRRSCGGHPSRSFRSLRRSASQAWHSQQRTRQCVRAATSLQSTRGSPARAAT